MDWVDLVDSVDNGSVREIGVERGCYFVGANPRVRPNSQTINHQFSPTFPPSLSS